MNPLRALAALIRPKPLIVTRASSRAQKQDREVSERLHRQLAKELGREFPAKKETIR